ncbi:MAG: mannosyltransferase family protein [Solirubrobacteraceae bacterium]
MSATSLDLSTPEERPDVRDPTARGALARLARSPIAQAVVGSRMLVLLTGVLAALSTTRAEGWQAFDPGGLTVRLGWLGNVLAAPAVRWDSLHYLTVAEHGYTSGASTAFFPGYPLLISLLATVLGSAVWAGLLISLVCFAVALSLLHRLTELELGGRAANATIWLLAFAPAALFFSALYTESLFLALSVGAFYAARTDRWALAGLLGALAGATRVTGVLLLAPLAVMAWRHAPRQRRRWVLLVPVGPLVYLLALAAFGYSPLAPLTAQTGGEHAHRLAGPLVTVLDALRGAGAGGRGILGGAPVFLHSLASPFAPGAESVYLLGVLLVSLAALVACTRRLPAEYAVLAAISLLFVTAAPVTGQPLKSLDRYALVIFPLWMATGAWMAERRIERAAVLGGGALLVFFTTQFVAWSFVA